VELRVNARVPVLFAGRALAMAGAMSAAVRARRLVKCMARKEGEVERWSREREGERKKISDLRQE
jgi:hypothetical protein